MAIMPNGENKMTTLEKITDCRIRLAEVLAKPQTPRTCSDRAYWLAKIEELKAN